MYEANIFVADDFDLINMSKGGEIVSKTLFGVCFVEIAKAFRNRVQLTSNFSLMLTLDGWNLLDISRCPMLLNSLHNRCRYTGGFSPPDF